jgi:hypothetical protein
LGLAAVAPVLGSLHAQPLRQRNHVKKLIQHLTDAEVNRLVGGLQGHTLDEDGDRLDVRGIGGAPTHWDPCGDHGHFDEVIEKWRYAQCLKITVEMSPTIMRCSVMDHTSRVAYGQAATQNRAVLNALLGYHFGAEVEVP